MLKIAFHGTMHCFHHESIVTYIQTGPEFRKYIAPVYIYTPTYTHTYTTIYGQGQFRTTYVYYFTSSNSFIILTEMAALYSKLCRLMDGCITYLTLFTNNGGTEIKVIKGYRNGRKVVEDENAKCTISG
jgi:hypothetical protein